MRLDGDRIYLRPLEEKDAEELVEYSRDEDVLRYTHIPNEYPIEKAKDFIKEQRELREKGTEYAFAIIRKEDEQFLGGAGIHLTKRDYRGELGYWLGKEFRGNGYVSEAVQLLLRFGFEEKGLHKAVITCAVDNEASRKVILRAGGIQEGVLREHNWNGTEFVDIFSYGILKEEWSQG